MGAVWSGVLPYVVGLAVIVAVVRTRRLREREPGLAMRQRIGLLVLTIPIFTLLGVGLASFPSLAGSSTPVPASADLLAYKALLHLALYLFLPLTGLALVLGPGFLASARRALAPSRPALARGLRSCAVISAILGGGLLVTWGLAGGKGGLLAADGASLFFSQTTPLVALALSAIAAIAEEIMFRGVVLDWLKQRTSVSAAVIIQALAFGSIHAGYGSLVHVLAATGFGAMMGVLVLRQGLVPAIAVHLLVNLVILSLWSGHAVLLLLAASLALVALLAAAIVDERSPQDSVGSARTPSPGGQV